MLPEKTTKSTLGNILLLTASIVVSLAIGEVMLRYFTPFPIHSGFSNKLQHAELGYTMDTKLADIDEKGFRNSRYNPHPDVITIGDSHTYGYNVSREHSWPAILSTISGKSVYNKAIQVAPCRQKGNIPDCSKQARPHPYTSVFA